MVSEAEPTMGFKVVALKTVEDQRTKARSVSVLSNHFNFFSPFPFFILWELHEKDLFQMADLSLNHFISR